VDATPRLSAPVNAALIRLALAAAVAAMVAPALAQPYVAVGQCRSGVPNGGYELRTPDGRLRAVGAFTQGRMTGTFIFWTSRGARIAVLPFDNDVRSGTVALWYPAPDGRGEAGHKLEAPYTDDQLHGIKRSWYPDGAPRAEYRYEHGVLAEARAWASGGAPLADTDALQLAARDAETDEQQYAALVAIVRDNPPACDYGPNGGNAPELTGQAYAAIITGPAGAGCRAKAPALRH